MLIVPLILAPRYTTIYVASFCRAWQKSNEAYFVAANFARSNKKLYLNIYLQWGWK